jgi:hypothetical protein
MEDQERVAGRDRDTFNVPMRAGPEGYVAVLQRGGAPVTSGLLAPSRKVRLLDALLLSCLVPAALVAQGAGNLARLAAAARSQGRTTASFDVLDDETRDGSFPDSILKSFSFVVKRSFEPNALTTAMNAPSPKGEGFAFD